MDAQPITFRNPLGGPLPDSAGRLVFVEEVHRPATLRWDDWLRAQRRYVDCYRAGYRAHTPESVLLTFRHRLDEALEWTVPPETERRT